MLSHWVLVKLPVASSLKRIESSTLSPPPPRSHQLHFSISTVFRDSSIGSCLHCFFCVLQGEVGTAAFEVSHSQVRVCSRPYHCNSSTASPGFRWQPGLWKSTWFFRQQHRKRHFFSFLICKGISFWTKLFLPPAKIVTLTIKIVSK